MKKIVLLTLSLICTSIFSQKKFVYGEPFEYNNQYEKDIKLILCDDYNQYVFSNVNEDGYSSYPHKKIIIKKLDQKGSLIDTYIKDYANKTNGVLHNYLGSREISKDQFVDYTEEIETKINRKEIFQHIFNRKDGSFNTTSIAKLFVEGGMKQGITFLKFSENGKYVAIVNDRSSSKKSTNTIDNIVVDLSTFSKKWSKEITLDTDYMEVDAHVTNSGRILVLRKSTGWKESSKLVYISEQGDQEIPLLDKLILKTLAPVTINNQDYLVSFGYFTGARINQSDYGDMAFINLQNNNIVMSKFPVFRTNTNMSDVEISLIQNENNKTFLYAYSVDKTTPQSTPANRFPDPIISYGKGNWIIINSDGTAIMDTTPYYGKIGYFTKDRVNYFLINQNEILPLKYGTTSNKSKLSIYNNSERGDLNGETILTSIKYVPESDRIILLRKIGKNNLGIKSIYNFETN